MRDSIVRELKGIVGEENAFTSKEDILCYGYDATGLEHLPEIVLRPGGSKEVAEILFLANRETISVIPRGASTGLSGGTIPIQGGIVLDLTRLNQILEIDRENLLAVVEPGVVTVDLHNKVESLGLFYPPDPSSLKASTLGGNVAENSGGLRGLKYGVTKDYVMGLEVVSPTGEIYKTGARTVKSVAGYNLTQLLVGSEGTLGVFTKITLKLIPLPEYKKSMLAIFEKIDDAAKCVTRIIAAGVLPSTLEILDNITINAVEDFKKIGLRRDAGAILLLETDGVKEAALREADKVIKVCQEMGAFKIEVAETEEERTKIWEGRRAALSSLARIKPTALLEDATVPRSKIPEMIAALDRIAKRYRVSIGTFGHAGDGNLHPTILTDERNGEEKGRVDRAVEEIFHTALSLGGTLTGEHGIGMTKSRFLALETGEEALEKMRMIKRMMDPNNILNPGKIFYRG